MTRETKIGLLVGLAFIIVIGILLSDHLTSATEPPQAPLAQAGNDVRRGVATPGGASAPVTQVQVPQQVAPGSAIATTQELTPRPTPVTVVQIGPAPSSNGAATQPVQTQVAGAQGGTAQQGATAQPQSADQAGGANDATHGGNSTLEQVANTMNEPVVPVGQSASNNNANSQQQGNGQTAVGQQAAGRQYKAQAGDSLSKMAARFYGTSNKSTQQILLDANPGLKQNPNMIVVGKTYVVPPGPGNGAGATQINTAQAATPSVPMPNVPRLAENVNIVHEQATAQSQQSNAAIASAPAYTYTVKDGDTLRKIAASQLGTADAVSAILELNKDKIKNANTIVVGMKLRLPAKPVTAVAQSQ